MGDMLKLIWWVVIGLFRSRTRIGHVVEKDLIYSWKKKWELILFSTNLAALLEFYGDWHLGEAHDTFSARSATDQQRGQKTPFCVLP
jgi:hypothetical protein